MVPSCEALWLQQIEAVRTVRISDDVIIVVRPRNHTHQPLLMLRHHVILRSRLLAL